MEDYLETIFSEQKVLNKRIGSDNTTPQQCFDFLGALLHEVVEARDELHWKWWKKSHPPINQDALKEELVDCLHFLVSAMLSAGMDAKEVTNLYLHKNEVNHKRQD